MFPVIRSILTQAKRGVDKSLLHGLIANHPSDRVKEPQQLFSRMSKEGRM
jgi:hypothetical protein